MWDDKYKGEKFIHQDDEEFEDGLTLDLETVSAFYNNDEYLYSQTEELQDSTSPVTRKRFSPVVCNQNKSFGVKLKGKNYVFDDRTSLDPCLRISPSHNSFVNYTASTVKVNDKNKFAPPLQPVKINNFKRRKLNTSTRTYFDKRNRHGHINEYWYISYKRGKPYSFKKKWMNEDDRKMSAVCRAQTFVPKVSGHLEELSLKLKSPKHPSYPLIVEIVKATSYKNPPRRKAIRNSLKEDDPSEHILLTRAFLKSHGTSPSLRTVKFSKPAYVEKGKYYAIILRSPFTRARDPYWIGGWTKWCKQSHQKGSAYTSVDNGWHWKKHGKLEKTSRNHGRWAPTNFYYIAGIRPAPIISSEVKNMVKKGLYYLYTKPIKLNPVKHLRIYSTKTGNVSFEVSDNASGGWKKLEDKEDKITYDEGKLPNQIMIRAVFDYKEGGDTVPSLDYFDICPIMEKPHDAVLRTNPYAPRINGLLGASIYGKINAPYKVNGKMEEKDGVSVNVDIVRETNYAEYISVISFRDIEDYDDIDIVDKLLSEESTKDLIKKIIDEKNQERYVSFVNDFLKKYPELRKELVSESIYILEDEEFKYITLEHKPSYPLTHFSFQPYFPENDNYDKYMDLVDEIKEDQDLVDLYDAGVLTKDEKKRTEIIKKMGDKEEAIGKLIEESNIKIDDDLDGIDFTEFLDYSVDYNNGRLRLNDKNLNKVRKRGYFIIEYNPCFIKNLKNEDLPLRVDLFTEKFMIRNMNDFEFKLKVPALDPIRKVCVNIDTNEEIVLVEDKDFVVNYANQTIKIYNNPNINVDDEITVKYTPYLVDNAISILYRIHRDNVDDKVEILPNYIEYKT